MTTRIEASSADELYRDLLHEVLWYGFRNPDRGTQESLVVVATLTDPRNRVITNSQRALSPIFMLKEFLWMFEGRNDVFSPTMKKWEVDGKIPGAYGKRLRHWNEHRDHLHGPDSYCDEGLDQIENVVQMLKQNPSTRKAVLNIYNATHDQTEETVDACCNVMMMLSINDDELDGTVIARSIDLYTGFPYDLFHFASFLEYIAVKVGVGLGHLTYVINNLHIYDRDHDFLKTVLWQGTEEQYDLPVLTDCTVQELRDMISSSNTEGALTEPWATMQRNFRLRKALTASA